MIQILRRASTFIEKLGMYITLIYTTAVTVLVIVGVGFRIFGNALSWSEELARWLIIGIGFIGASVVFKRGGHMGINSLMEIMPLKTQRYVLFLSNLLIAVFLVITLWSGTISAFRSIMQVGAILPIPLFYLRIHIPIGAAFILIHIIVNLLELFSGRDPAELFLSKTVIDEEAIHLD